jgi:YggT family protein
MSLPFIRAIDFVVNGLIILFLMKLVVDPREFFFNSALRPVDLITDPILERLRRFIRPTRYGMDYTPLAGIVILILLYVLSYWLLTPLGFLIAAATCLQKLLFFLIRFFTFSIFVLTMVPVYSRNPISSFLKKLIVPFEKPFRKLTDSNDKKPSLVTAFIAALVTGVVLNLLLAGLQSPNFTQYVSFWKNWLFSAITIVTVGISVYRFIILMLIAAVVLSWVNADMRNPFINLVFVLTEPMLLPFRRVIPPAGGLDLSPWVAGLVIGIIGNLFTTVLLNVQKWLQTLNI